MPTIEAQSHYRYGYGYSMTAPPNRTTFLRAALLCCLALASLGCGSAAKPTSTTLSERDRLIRRYYTGFMTGWNSYTAEQKKDFCWAANDFGISQAGENASEMERSRGGTVDEAEAASVGMKSFILDVC